SPGILRILKKVSSKPSNFISSRSKKSVLSRNWKNNESNSLKRTASFLRRLKNFKIPTDAKPRYEKNSNVGFLLLFFGHSTRKTSNSPVTGILSGSHLIWFKAQNYITSSFEENPSEHWLSRPFRKPSF